MLIAQADFGRSWNELLCRAEATQCLDGCEDDAKISKCRGSAPGRVCVLICSEVIRPFRDLAVDGPIALACWAIGAALAIACFFLKSRSMAFSVISLAANVLPLVVALVLLWLMSQSNFGWH